MLHIAGQTAGPNGLKFFVDTHGVAGGVLQAKNHSKKFQFFFSNKKKFRRATPGPSANVI